MRSFITRGPGLALILLLAAVPVSAWASQTVIDYTFAGAVGTPATTASGVAGSELTRDDSADTFYDNTAGNPAPDANSGGWTTAAALDPALYYTFTVTPAAGGTSWNAITLDLANFDADDIDDGPTQFAVRSSLDGFTADLLTGAVGNGFTTDTASLNVTSAVPVEYRIYGFDAGTEEGLLQIDNVALTFTAPVPEPSTVAMLGVAALFGGLVFARRRRA